MWARCAAALLMLLALTTPAASQDDARQIFRNVQREVLGYPYFTMFDSVHAQISDDGVLTLTGKVTLAFKRTEIERRVSRVRGLKKIDNRIDVLPASKFDDELRTGIANAIYGHPALSRYGAQVNPSIHIIVERGRVTLEGVVNSEVDRALARSIAASFRAFSVTNDLKTDAEVRRELE